MPDQTLPDFLFAVITEQRKSVSSLVDALNEAKDGINQLSVTVERSEENRHQVETLLERQSVVEGDLKFDLTQCRQHNEVLRGQVKTLEENLDSSVRAGELRSYAFLEKVKTMDAERTRLQAQYDKARDINETLHASYVRLRVLLKADVLPKGVEVDDAHIVAFTEQRALELVDFRDKVYGSPVVAWLSSDTNLTHRQYNEDDIPLIVAPTLAAGTLDCAVPPAETPVASANEGETGLVLDEG